MDIKPKLITICLLGTLIIGISGCGWRNVFRSTGTENKEVVEFIKKTKYPKASEGVSSQTATVSSEDRKQEKQP